MLNSVILVFANKQDLYLHGHSHVNGDKQIPLQLILSLALLLVRGTMAPMEVAEGLGLHDLRTRTWHAQGTCALSGDGLYEGLDWLVSALKELQVPGRHPA
ncbi:hypothetical protein ZIOFF_059671 [Zingiber officinale]|uniref:ADP-ribosylation factor n=1 Tax=Zingiber officinale TaxID=94328 RepID=A0A8J5KH31_ZINOF|nr:hypothetical protein ZIOFF_059671 [Zingiber officinale]